MITIGRLVELLKDAYGITPRLQHGPPRARDVRHSLADISAAQEAFGYDPAVSMEEGLKECTDWAKREATRR